VRIIIGLRAPAYPAISTVSPRTPGTPAPYRAGTRAPLDVDSEQLFGKNNGTLGTPADQKDRFTNDPQ
jgi:hypothetical protein